LSPEQREVWFDRARADLLAQRPFLERHQERGSKVIEMYVRDRVVRRLDEEKWTSLPPGYLPMWLAAKSETFHFAKLPCSGSKTQKATVCSFPG